MKHVVLALVLLSCLRAYGAQPENWFGEANRRYQQQDYLGAIAYYDSIVQAGFAHPETFYNLGNAHYRLGHVGQAIRSYEKALKLNPEDADAQHNLALANKRTLDQFVEVPAPILKRVLAMLSGWFGSGTWTVMAIGCLVLALFAAALFFFKMRSTVLAAAFIFFFLLAALLEAVAYGTYSHEQQVFAIVMVPNSYLKSAPGTAAADLYIVHEGTKVNVLDHFEGWNKVRLPDGKIAWAPATDLGEI